MDGQAGKAIIPERLIIATLFLAGKKMYKSQGFRDAFIAAGSLCPLFEAFSPHPQYGTSDRLEEAIACLYAGTLMTVGDSALLVSKAALGGKTAQETLDRLSPEERAVISGVAEALSVHEADI